MAAKFCHAIRPKFRHDRAAASSPPHTNVLEPFLRHSIIANHLQNSTSIQNAGLFFSLSVSSTINLANFGINAESQILPHQAKACQGAKAEPPYSSVDSPQDRKHHPVSRRVAMLRQKRERRKKTFEARINHEWELTADALQIQREEKALAQDQARNLNAHTFAGFREGWARDGLHGVLRGLKRDLRVFTQAKGCFYYELHGSILLMELRCKILKFKCLKPKPHGPISRPCSFCFDRLKETSNPRCIHDTCFKLSTQLYPSRLKSHN